jgi:hypothetical protein
LALSFIVYRYHQHSNNGIDGVMGWDWDSQLRFASVPSASLSALTVGLQSLS